ncbi:MAG: hypothetical protein ACC656_15260, partial [Candidatus Heimdallarchaeota archaeon]
MLDNLSQLENGNFIYPAGFEFIFPSLLQKIKVIRENANIEKIIKIRQQKLDKLPLELIVKEKTPKNFSLEFLDGVDINLDHFVEKNGSIATSPATTSWYLGQQENSSPEIKKAMERYLLGIQNYDGGFSSFADYKLMNVPFVLYPLTKIGLTSKVYKNIIEIFLQPHWQKEGVGHSQYFPMTDADDTSVSLYLFEKYKTIETNDEKYWKALDNYKRDNFYVTYPYEVVSSHLVNLHVLDLFNETDHPDKDQKLAKLVTYFERVITKETGIGEDKYHASPYCQNCHGVLAFAENYPQLSNQLIDWFWDNQQVNGLWGSFGKESVEETAYAVLSICFAHEKG